MAMPRGFKQEHSDKLVCREFDGVVIYYPPYHLDQKTMISGYKVLRRCALHASREVGRPVPKAAQEVLKWLRDTYIGAYQERALRETKQSGTCSAPAGTHSESTPSAQSAGKGSSERT